MIKKFEEYSHIDIDPYGEEDWEGPKVIDLSNKSIDEKVKELNILINDQLLIYFNYNKLVIIDFEYNEFGDFNEIKKTEGAGKQEDVILDVYKEKNDIIFKTTAYKYINEDWYNIDMIYTLDQNQPVTIENIDNKEILMVINF